MTDNRRIAVQLLSAEDRSPKFIAEAAAQIKQFAAADTTVVVRGTTRGAFADDYRLFAHFDAREVIDTTLHLQETEPFDAWSFANSLDVAIVELREVLDVPVLSMMEVGCFSACMMGDRFGVLVPKPKFIPRYREIVHGYGLASRLSSVEAFTFSTIPGMNRMFDDDTDVAEVVTSLEAAAARTVEAGAEVLVIPGPPSVFLHQHGVHELAGAPVVHGYRLLVRWAEIMVDLARIGAPFISRKGLYSQPPVSLLEQGAKVYDVDALDALLRQDPRISDEEQHQ